MFKVWQQVYIWSILIRAIPLKIMVIKTLWKEKWWSPWICYFKNPECILLFMSYVPFFNSNLHVYMYVFQLVSNWNVYIICVQTANKIDGALDKMISWFYSWVCCCVSPALGRAKSSPVSPVLTSYTHLGHSANVQCYMSCKYATGIVRNWNSCPKSRDST